MATKTKAPEPEAKDGEPAKKKPNVKMLGVIGLVLVLLISGLVAKSLMGKTSKKPVPKEIGSHVRLDEFLVNLADPGNDKYLKTNITLGLDKSITDEQFKESVAPVRDSILMLLTSKKLDDIRSTEGKTELKAELKAAINKTLGKEEVLEVDFETFATQ